MLWGALCLALMSWPLQVFSHATTCNNGSYSAFMAGSIVTAPLLVGLAVLLVVANVRASKPPIAAAIAIVTCQFTMLLFDADIVFNSIAYGTPCGADMVDAFVQVSALDRLFIIFAYLVMPLVNILLGGSLIRQSKRLRAGP